MKLSKVAGIALSVAFLSQGFAEGNSKSVSDALSSSAPASKKSISSQKSTVKFRNDEEKLSYIIGHQVASSIRNDELKVNRPVLMKAIEAGLKGQESTLTPQETQAFMQKYFADLQKSRGAKNLNEGKAFLDKNKRRPGVKTLSDGLQYEVVVAGKGPTPKSTDTVTVNYEGKLVNGKVFDSSYARKQPATFPVSAVIKGWTEALQMMPVGSIWKLYIPSNLAYGEKAPSPSIGMNSTLIFKVHLLSIAKPPKNPPAKKS